MKSPIKCTLYGGLKKIASRFRAFRCHPLYKQSMVSIGILCRHFKRYGIENLVPNVVFTIPLCNTVGVGWRSGIGC
jgi:hypothetical protein